MNTELQDQRIIVEKLENECALSRAHRSKLQDDAVGSRYLFESFFAHHIYAARQQAAEHLVTAMRLESAMPEIDRFIARREARLEAERQKLKFLETENR